VNRVAIVRLLIVPLLLSGCTAAAVTVAPEAVRVQVGDQPPSGRYEQVGAITARHGGGCGLYGSQGNFEGAVAILKNKAAAMGANYVHILRTLPEHMTGICLDRAFLIDGMAYKVQQ
jgi:hypothetical protein